MKSSNKQKKHLILVNHVEHEAKKCQFSCQNANYTIPSINIHYQIIIQTSMIFVEMLSEKQWEILEIQAMGCQLEAATYSALKITSDSLE